MSVNKYQPHVHILPEDDANRQIADGFTNNPCLNIRSVQVLPPSGGWAKVIEEFAQVHAPEMNRWRERRMVLLVDFDQQDNRMQIVQSAIPDELQNRVYVVGIWSEPERLCHSPYASEQLALRPCNC